MSVEQSLTRAPLIALELDAAAFGPAGGTSEAWLDVVQAAELAGVGLITVADRFAGGDGVARLDAIMRAAWLAARTSAVAVMAAADTTVTEPYLLAVQLATIDFVSGGRAGWLAQVSGAPQDGGYVGPRPVATGSAAWDEAEEFIAVVRALWDSWEDDAEIRDVPGQRFIDRDRIHHIDHTGAFLSVKGPSIAPRSPQGQPPVGLALGEHSDERALALASAGADVLFLAPAQLDLGRRVAAEAERSGRLIRLIADLEVDAGAAAEVGALIFEGWDGVRLRATALPAQAAAVVDLLASLGIDAQGDPPTLRDRLGLTRPPSRYATPGAGSPAPTRDGATAGRAA